MEERIVNTTTGGEKGTKPERYDLVPIIPLAHVARHYGVGAEKYEDNNWRKGYDWSLSYAAAMRHMTQFWGGEDIDPENGQPHLAAVVFHCFSMMEWAETHPELDSRPTSLIEKAAVQAEIDALARVDHARARAREIRRKCIERSTRSERPTYEYWTETLENERKLTFTNQEFWADRQVQRCDDWENDIVGEQPYDY